VTPSCLKCDGQLSGKAKKYCSKYCAKAHYQEIHKDRQNAANKKCYQKHRAARLAAGRERRKTEHVKALNKKWREANPDKLAASEARRKEKKRQHMREYNQRPEVIERNRQWRQDNAAKILNDNRAWRAKNPERARDLWSRGVYVRRARLKAAGKEPVSVAVVFERAGWRCELCGVKTPAELRGTYKSNAPTVDHIIAVVRGGTHTYDNLRCACRKCNISRRERPAESKHPARSAWLFQDVRQSPIRCTASSARSGNGERNP
jgi:hypothetical protein